MAEDGLEIFEFDVRDESKDLAAQLRAAAKGNPALEEWADITAREVRKNFNLDLLPVQAVNKLAIGGVESIRRHIPFDTQELKTNHIKVDFARRAAPTARVMIDSLPHSHPRRKTSIEASYLADILDKGANQNGPMHRTYGKDYWPHNKGNPLTRSWIAEAQIDFENNKDTIFSRFLGEYNG